MPDSPKTPVAPVAPWIERWLLVVTLFLSLLLGYLAVAGSLPLQRVERINKDSATLLCFRVRDNMSNDEANGKLTPPETKAMFDSLCGKLIDDFNEQQ